MGITEILTILVVALMLFSPRELPKMVKSIARFYGSLRRTAEQFRQQLLDDEELREPIDEFRKAYYGSQEQLQRVQNLARQEIHQASTEARQVRSHILKAAEDFEVSGEDEEERNNEHSFSDSSLNVADSSPSSKQGAA